MQSQGFPLFLVLFPYILISFVLIDATYWTLSLFCPFSGKDVSTSIRNEMNKSVFFFSLFFPQLPNLNHIFLPYMGMNTTPLNYPFSTDKTDCDSSVINFIFTFGFFFALLKALYRKRCMIVYFYSIFYVYCQRMTRLVVP